MRKESSKAKKTVTERMMAILIGVLMVGLVFSAVPFLFLGDGTQTVTERYNGFVIEQTHLGYGVEVDDVNYIFSSHPQDANSAEASQEALNRLKGARVLSITSNFTDDQAGAIEGSVFVLSNLLDQQSKFTTLAYTEENAGREARTCADATEAVPVLLYESSNETSGIALENNCVVVRSRTTSGFSLLTDRIRYELLGVLNGQ